MVVHRYHTFFFNIKTKINVLFYYKSQSIPISMFDLLFALNCFVSSVTLYNFLLYAVLGI